MGNETYDGTTTYSYDAEGKPVNIGGIQVAYDALGRMVETNNGGTYTQTIYTPDGKKFAHMNGATLQQYFLPLAAGVTAVFSGSGLQYYRHADWLGSSRMASTPTGSLHYDGAYAPFGENYVETTTIDRSFTGQTQDTVSGLYDFLFRRQSPAQGRWISPDPAGLAAVDITNPQTWNRYAYVGNNPLNGTDLLGLYTDVCPPDYYGGDCSEPPGDGGVGGGGIGIPCSWCRGGIGAGGGRGAGGGGQPPSGSPGGGGNIANFPSGESLGIPNGLPTSPWGVLPAFLPSNLPCPAGLSSLCSGISPLLAAEKWFGTDYCGPGGSGPVIKGTMDPGCYAHDVCYTGNAFSAASNYFYFISAGREQQLQACNQALCDYASAHPDAKGSDRILLYFLSVPVGACHSTTHGVIQ